jgi:N-acetyl-anhydromuramyl-L-alanine amidase AmpD
MSRLILPGDRPRPTTAQIFVPTGYENAPRRVVGVCHICGERFEEPGQEADWQKHVGACARAHMAEIHAESERRRKSVFHEDQWDPEVAEHLRKVGERMIEEGRLEVRPNERAGL